MKQMNSLARRKFPYLVASSLLLCGLSALGGSEVWAQQVMMTISKGNAMDLFSEPQFVVFDKAGNLFVSDTGNHRVQRLDRQTGIITTVAGTGVAGYNGDNIPAASAQLDCPSQMAFDTEGNLYISDACQHRVRKVVTGADQIITGAVDEIITTYVGDGTVAGCSNDLGGVLATQTGIDGPASLAIDRAGNLFVAAQGSCINVIRRVDAVTGLISTANFNDDSTTEAMTFDGAGNLLLDPGGCSDCIDLVSPNAGSSLLTGSESQSAIAQHFPLIGGIPTPAAVTFDSVGNLYESENSGWDAVFKYTPIAGGFGLSAWSKGATADPYAGIRSATGYSGDGSLATEATMNTPMGLAFNSAGNLFIADSGNNVIRAVVNGAATDAGSSVAVNPLDQNGDARTDVTVTFDSVTAAGAMVAVTGQNAPPLPANFELAGSGKIPPPAFYDIATTAQFSGNATVCITLQPLPTGARLLHFDKSMQQWIDVTTTVSLTGGQICGQVTSFSPFAVVQPVQQNQPPAITSAGSATLQVGVPGAFTVTATGTPTPTITAAGAMPGGVSFVNNGDGTATLSGTPAAGAGGTYPITLTATNGVSPDATQNFVLTITQPPAITSANTTTLAMGAAGSFMVTATGFPTPALTEAGTLPGGVAFVDNHNGTATLSGTPNASGTFVLTLTARNGVASDATQTFTLNVSGRSNAALAITPTSIDFGSVERFHLATRTVTLQNMGSGKVTLGKVSLTLGAHADWDDFFFLNLCPSTLGAGKGCGVLVYYFADDLGTANATLNIPNSAGGSPQAVSLVGTGVGK